MQFKPGIPVLSGIYRLGDVIDIADNNINGIEKLLALEIAEAPLPGQFNQHTQFEIEARLERSLAGINHYIRWQGERSIRVRGGGVSYSDTELVSYARKFLHLWLIDQHRDYSLTEISLERIGKESDLVLPPGKVGYAARLPNLRGVNKRIRIFADVFVDDKLVTTLPIWFDVTVKAEVLVALNKKNPLQALSKSDFTFENRDIAGLANTPIVSLPEGNWRAKDYLLSGNILTHSQIEPQPLVAQGESIIVHVVHGSVSLSVPAIALADGAMNEKIPVENPSSSETYYVTVAGDGMAKVN